jgi:hypothetical protein
MSERVSTMPDAVPLDLSGERNTVKIAFLGVPDAVPLDLSGERNTI